MKKIILSLSAIIVVALGTNAQNVTIPDARLKTCLVNDSLININRDSEIQLTEANSFTGKVQCSFRTNDTITTLAGLDAFVNTRAIEVIRGIISYVDLSANTDSITIFFSRLDSVNISGLSQLKAINFRRNNLTKLDVSTNTALRDIDIQENKIRVLDTDNLVNLEKLNLLFNDSISGIDLSLNDSLKEFTVSRTVFPDTTFDLSNKPNLELISFSNTNISNLNLQNSTNIKSIQLLNNQFSALDLSAFDSLKSLSIRQEYVNNLDFSNNLELEYLNAWSCDLNSVNISNNSKLESINLFHNNLTTLATENKPFLNYMAVDANDITSLNISNDTSLEVFSAAFNKLSTITFLNNKNLSGFDASNNKLTNLDLSPYPLIYFARADSNNLQTFNVKNGNNVNFLDSLYFSAVGNPNLTCIQVDDTAYSNSTWTRIDSIASYSTNCNYVTSLEESTIENKLNIYPNPSSGIFNISKMENVKSVEVYGMNGQQIEGISIRENEINLTDYPNGI
jgi:Leucine-rich repeat (LRR) protein